LTRLAQAAAPVTLVIETTRTPDAIEQAALDAPWELIARAGTERTSRAIAPAPIDELVPDPMKQLLEKLGPVDWQYVQHAALEPSFLLTVVRRLGPPTPPLEPSKYRLSVVFMPCQPDGAVDVWGDAQEVAIRRASGSIGIDLEVEDSGSLEGLGDLIARRGACDVVQVSCPATMSPRPALALEGARGERVDATAADIWNGIGQKPRLLVVSASAEPAPGPAAGNRREPNASAVAVGSRVLGPLATELCQRGWPAVIGLPGATGGQAEIELAAALYRLLAQRVSLPEAFARARLAVAGNATGGVWHKARLLLGPGGGGQLVDSADARPTRPDVIRDQQFLDPNRRIPIATDYQSSLHRRAFQRVVALLRDVGSPGIVVHGSDELSRATFVSRVLHRVERELRRVVVVGELDALAILGAVREQTAHPEVATLANEYGGKLQDDPRQLRDVLRAVIEGPCRDRGAGAFVLVLHNFELTSTPDQLVVFRALLGAFVGAGTASRLIFTCAAPFAAADHDGFDLSKWLAFQSLAAGARSAAPVVAAKPVPSAASHTVSTAVPHPAEQSADDRLARAPLQWRRILVAGIAIAGLGVTLGVNRTRPIVDPRPTVDPQHDPRGVIDAQGVSDASLSGPGMVRFKAADIRMGVFATGARPAECDQVSAEDDCGERRHPESVGITHVAAFDLDKLETTNDDFYAWLNANTNDWLPPGNDGIVKDQHDKLAIVQTKSCLEGLAITPGGQVQQTASSAQRPVVCVTWYGADKYCRSLGKRLPRDAEWEIAARGVEGRPFPWGGDPPRPGGVAYELPLPHAVGTSLQDVSPDGIRDLAGNVAEWVQSDRDTPEMRSVRGGTYSSQGSCRVLGSRCARIPWLRSALNVGFRCARDAYHQ
jgi:formylglycine-generating enzyme required for sulfatase activity